MNNIISNAKVLSRSEMKNIMAGIGGECGSGGTFPVEHQGLSFCSCTYNGCEVSFYQFTGPDEWLITSCAGTSCGSGTYTGTVCGGGCP